MRTNHEVEDNTLIKNGHKTSWSKSKSSKLKIGRLLVMLPILQSLIFMNSTQTSFSPLMFCFSVLLYKDQRQMKWFYDLIVVSLLLFVIFPILFSWQQLTGKSPAIMWGKARIQRISREDVSDTKEGNSNITHWLGYCPTFTTVTSAGDIDTQGATDTPLRHPSPGVILTLTFLPQSKIFDWLLI